jgi:hypothetical protein
MIYELVTKMGRWIQVTIIEDGAPSEAKRPQLTRVIGQRPSALFASRLSPSNAFGR